MCTQRMKALCLSQEVSNWDRAHFLELVPEEDKSVVVQLSDMKVVTKESELKMKLQGTSSLGKNSDFAGKGSFQWIPTKANAKGQNMGNDKVWVDYYNEDQSNKKGKGKGKGKDQPKNQN